MSEDDYLPPCAFYETEIANTVIQSSVHNYTDARSYTATIGVDPAVAIGLSQGMAQAAGQSHVLAAEVEATRTQAERTQESLKATAQAAHDGIIQGLRAEHARELESLRAAAGKMQSELQGSVTDLTARIAHADALLRQTEDARRAADAKANAAERRAAEEQDKTVSAERAARISSDKLAEQVRSEQDVREKWVRDREACKERIDRLREEVRKLRVTRQEATGGSDRTAGLAHPASGSGGN